MSTPVPDAMPGAGSPPMTPERWREVNAILNAALDLEPERRGAFIANACAEDDGLRREVASLLAAHDTIDDDFLERPAAEALGVPTERQPLAERLASALAGRYAIEREVAHGGMATVYLARDLRHDRRVAIKVLREELAAAVGAERFLAEIRVTASLQHPHILPLFDSGSLPRSAEGPPVLYYVMPFVEGETLRARLSREGRLSVDLAIRLAREMAEALEHAHQHGIVHRDVKPENVLLQGPPNGDGAAPAGGWHALVADFGVALALQQAGGERLTRTGIAIGTPQYMAPEQAAGDRAIDARADVFALGAVLREMLTGESPVVAPPHGVARRVSPEGESMLAARRADVPPFVDAVVQRALAQRPDDRFPSAATFAVALAAPVGGGGEMAGSPGGELPDASRAVNGDAAPATRSRGRTVSARAAMYAALATLIVGLAGGWGLARSSLWERWTSSPPSGSWPSPTAVSVDRAPPDEGDITLAVVDRAGRTQRTIAATRPWTPRFSPDGRRVAYGAFGDGRSTSDLWVMTLADGSTQRLTDDDADSNDPQWSPDGSTIVYSVNAPGGKDLAARGPGGDVRVLAARNGTQFASDWSRDGRALLVADQVSGRDYDIIAQPADGSPAWPYASTRANETAARFSPDGRWVAYTSDESGREEVYLDSYPRPGHRVAVSSGGGTHPVWRGDGRELYYWSDGSMVAVQLGRAWGDAPPAVGTRTVLFRAPYQVGLNTMYDVSADGQRFVITRHR